MMEKQLRKTKRKTKQTNKETPLHKEENGKGKRLHTHKYINLRSWWNMPINKDYLTMALYPTKEINHYLLSFGVQWTNSSLANVFLIVQPLIKPFPSLTCLVYKDWPVLNYETCIGQKLFSSLAGTEPS